MFFNMSDAYFPIEKTSPWIRAFYIECNFYTNRQALYIIMERKELATKLLMFLKLLLRYMYLRADECTRHKKRDAINVINRLHKNMS